MHTHESSLIGDLKSDCTLYKLLLVQISVYNYHSFKNSNTSESCDLISGQGIYVDLDPVVRASVAAAQDAISLKRNEVNFARPSFTTVIGKANRLRVRRENEFLAKKYGATLLKSLVDHVVPEFPPAGFEASRGQTEIVRSLSYSFRHFSFIFSFISTFFHMDSLSYRLSFISTFFISTRHCY